MEAVEFLKHLKRMCDSMDNSCTGCPVYDDCNFEAVGGVFECSEKVENYIAEVEKWAKEHPVKTRQSEFLKMFPNAPIKECGIIDICPNMLGELIDGAVGTRCCIHVADGMSCDDCARNFWLAEIKDGEE